MRRPWEFILAQDMSIYYYNMTGASQTMITDLTPFVSTNGTFDGVGYEAALNTPMPDMETSVLTLLNSGDTAWMLTATALVLLMTPGVAFFYGGMVRHKNVISTIMQSFITMGIVTVIWVFLGFSLAFGNDIKYENGAAYANGQVPAQPNYPDPSQSPSDPNYFASSHGSIFGNPKTYYFYKDVGAAPNSNLAPTIPFVLYSLFQLVFAIITPALLTGGFAERVKFSSLSLFVVLWHLIVYCPLAHSVWHYNGILRRFGTLDFAGGTVVHMSSGWASFAGSWFLGPRKDTSNTPANVPFVLLGTAMLWFGWFGFNPGSALAAGPAAAQAFCTTNMAAASAMIAWLLVDVARGYKARATGACAGAVVGLVVITPAAGYVNVGAALIMGVVGSVVCHTVAHAVKSTRFDDTLDSFSCHGVGGTVGILMTGLFATLEVYPGGFDGGFYNKKAFLFWHHIVMVLIIVPIIVGLSLVCYQITDLILPMRVDEAAESIGLDVSQHGEKLGVHVDDEEFLAKINASVKGVQASAYNANRANLPGVGI
ncbi:MAG: hypothetical protein WDW36_007879 [Sanguina aurantia]